MATVKLDPAKGVQIPNLTTTERDAISSPETGALIWNTTTSAINQYNGSAWEITYTDTNTQADITGKLNLSGGTMTGDLTVYANASIGLNQDIPMDGTASGQLQIDGLGYKGAIALDTDGMNIYTNSSARDVVLGVNETEILRVKPTGVLVTGNVIIGTAGKGIDFSANGNAGGMTSELLDDYEEGTFDVSLTCNSVTITRECYYTKIGNMVTVNFSRTDSSQNWWGSLSGASGDAVTITSTLPFTPISTGGFRISNIRSLANASDLNVGWRKDSATLYLGTTDQNNYYPANNATKDTTQTNISIQGSGSYMTNS